MSTNQTNIGSDTSGASVGDYPRQASIGGVTVRFNEDGTLHIYQPDSNRNLSAELANKLTCWLLNNVDLDMAPHEADVTDQATVPAGVINTSDNTRSVDTPEAESPAAGSSATARTVVLFDSAKDTAETVAEFVDTRPEPEAPPPPVKRRPGRPPRNPRA